LLHAAVQLKWSHNFPDITHTTGERFAPVLAAWNADAGLDHDLFHDRYLGFAAGYHAVSDLRRAAALSRRPRPSTTWPTPPNPSPPRSAPSAHVTLGRR
jgi:hypothetical protein